MLKKRSNKETVKEEVVETEEVKEEVVEETEEVKEEVLEETEEVVETEEVKEEVVEETEEELLGVIDGCDKLYLREEASVESKGLTVLDKDTQVIVYPAQSTEEFYKVQTLSGNFGYCVKKFITIK